MQISEINLIIFLITVSFCTGLVVVVKLHLKRADENTEKLIKQLKKDSSSYKGRKS